MEEDREKGREKKRKGKGRRKMKEKRQKRRETDAKEERPVYHAAHNCKLIDNDPLGSSPALKEGKQTRVTDYYRQKVAVISKAPALKSIVNFSL